MNKEFDQKLKLLAYYQIAGGIIGIAMVLRAFAQADQVTNLLVLFMAGFLGLYGFSIYCGQLIRKKKIKEGLRLSIINQALQAISFAMLGYAYLYISGVSLSVGVDLSQDFSFTTYFQLSNFQFNINSDKELAICRINLVALFLIYFVQRLEAKIDERKVYDRVL